MPTVCQRQPANDADIGISGAGDQSPTAPSANAAATPINSKAATSELPGGSVVPAKRENLTAADRATFLRAIGLPDYAERSPNFVDWWNQSYGAPLKNAGVTFHSLGGDNYLVEIMVDQGASLSTSVYALYQETAVGKATANLLELEGYNSETGEIIKSAAQERVGTPVFDEQNKTLIITAAARGTGGGERVVYKIADNRARLVEARSQKCSDEMPPPEKWKLVSLKPADGSKLSSDGGNAG